MKNQTVMAVCGKGGVGKTVVSGALVRTLHERGLHVLAVDADPAMGLAYILGLGKDIKTLGNVREDLIGRARANKNADEIVGMIDYLLLESLIETDKFSFLAMGRSQTKGCFCPINTLLKASVKQLALNYDVVLVDAEAGIEQINREVISFVDSIAVLIDNSQRSRHSMVLIKDVVKDLGMDVQVGAVLNRWKDIAGNKESFRSEIEMPVWGVIPEDERLLENDALGRSVFDLEVDSPVLESARGIIDFIFNT